MNRYALFCVLLPPLACSACTIYIGPYEDNSASGRQLPEPNDRSGEEPTLDEAQQAKKEEAERYTVQVIYQGAEILAAFQLPSGDIIDFIDRDTLPGLPYDIPPLPFAPDDLTLPPGVEFGLTELEQIPELLALATTSTPFIRPAFWPYILGETDATSIEDYLARYQIGGQPFGVDRLYAGLNSSEPNRGVSGYVNQYRPEVESGSFSLIELTVACPKDGPAQEQIGVVISVDKANQFGRNREPLVDNEARLHIEYANSKVGYVWDGVDGNFVANPIRHHQPGEIVPASVLDETTVEHLLAIFQVPTGDWWVAYNGDLLGYYPASLFTMLNGSACRSAWYGEVYRDLIKHPGAVKTEMGSGEFADIGLLNAAHVRNPLFYDLSWFGTPLSETPSLSQSLIPNVPQCYTRSALMQLGAPWDSTFLFLGGPGGKDPGCKWP
jgi:hypothetical protein